MDGELEAHEAERAIRALLRAARSSKRTWSVYHVIGDAMRGTGAAQPRGSPAQHRGASTAQPTVLAPAPRASQGTRRAHRPRGGGLGGHGRRGRMDRLAGRALPGAGRQASRAVASRRWPACSQRRGRRCPVAARRRCARPCRRSTCRTTSRPIARCPSPDLYRPVANQRARSRLDEALAVRGRRWLPGPRAGHRVHRRPPARPPVHRRIRSPGCSAPPRPRAPTSYAGTFVHSNGERTSTVRITHVIVGGEEHERIEPLDGPPLRDRAPQRRDVLLLPGREDGAPRPARHRALLPLDAAGRSRRDRGELRREARQARSACWATMCQWIRLEPQGRAALRAAPVLGGRTPASCCAPRPSTRRTR